MQCSYHHSVRSVGDGCVPRLPYISLTGVEWRGLE